MNAWFKILLSSYASQKSFDWSPYENIKGIARGSHQKWPTQSGLATSLCGWSPQLTLWTRRSQVCSGVGQTVIAGHTSETCRLVGQIVVGASCTANWISCSLWAVVTIRADSWWPGEKNHGITSCWRATVLKNMLTYVQNTPFPVNMKKISLFLVTASSAFNFLYFFSDML